MHRHYTIARIDEQLQRVERMMLALVDGVDLDELSAYERLNVTIKLMQQHARLLMMRQSVEPEEPEKEDSIMLGVLMKQLRGEDGQQSDAQLEGFPQSGAELESPPQGEAP